jgi:tRNA pseudouridine32 synthase / 23S rRNA pseudouridine746 synthase
LGPARVRLRGGPLGDELGARFGPEVAAKVLAGEVVDQDGAVLDATTVLPAGSSVYLYRDLRDEVPVPFDIPVLYHDDDIVVVDKPHFLATMPLGRHVAQTALVRLRRELGLPELSPAHRLDRLTAGVLSPASGRWPQSADGLYRLIPRTGRTHQLRVHMASLGIPIHGDPLYPSVADVPDDDFSIPLQLLAQRIEFKDPLSGVRREFVSRRQLSDPLC